MIAHCKDDTCCGARRVARACPVVLRSCVHCVVASKCRVWFTYCLHDCVCVCLHVFNLGILFPSRYLINLCLVFLYLSASALPSDPHHTSHPSWSARTSKPPLLLLSHFYSCLSKPSLTRIFPFNARRKEKYPNLGSWIVHGPIWVSSAAWLERHLRASRFNSRRSL
jgi:hypothetical protein